MKKICENCKHYDHASGICKGVCRNFSSPKCLRVIFCDETCECFDEKTTIIEKIGEPAVLEQLAEECSELTQAALKYARKQRGENPTPKSFDECYDALQEEMADVMLCMEAYMENHSNDFYMEVATIKDEKKARWEQRIKEMEDATD